MFYCDETTVKTLASGMRHGDANTSPYAVLIVPDSGWHLTTFGGIDKVMRKIGNTCCNPTEYTAALYGKEVVRRAILGGKEYYKLKEGGGGLRKIDWSTHQHVMLPDAVRECVDFDDEGGYNIVCSWVKPFFLSSFGSANSPLDEYKMLQVRRAYERGRRANL